MSRKKIDSAFRFRRVGGAYQVLIENADDLRRVPSLDPAQWAMTSVQIDSVVADPEFLAFLDSDHNNRIRVDEVRAAIQWLFSMMKDPADVVTGEKILRIASIDETNPDGAALIKTIRLILSNVGCPNAPGINLEQIRNPKNFIADPLLNGDGIIPAVALKDPKLAELVNDIMKLCGKKPDLTGVDGVDKTFAGQYEKEGEAYLKWLSEVDQNQMIMPFGETTPKIYHCFCGIQKKVNEFFASCKTLAYTGQAETVRSTVSNQYDPFDAESVRTFLSKSLIAAPVASCVLKPGPGVNPLWTDALNAFLNAVRELPGFTDGVIRPDAWASLEKQLKAHADWYTGKTTSIFDGYDREKLADFLHNGKIAELKSLIEQDEAIGKNIQLGNTVRKLLLYQQYLFEFVNNFVCMHRLFDPEKKTMLQVGRLVMDGRHFTLAMRVYNVAEHKRIAAKCEICTMYLEVTSGEGASLKKMTVAVAVTSGHMRNLFVGKHGVFFTPDGQNWDARVIDFIQQPVSIQEAITMPFFKLGEFLNKQADKFFNAQSKTFEKGLETSLQSSPLAATPAKPPAAQQTPAISGSMILMGGGVGIAAIGSAVAFIANTLQKVSVFNIFAILFGIVFVFGAPIVVTSLVKLYCRNLAMLMEANGFALNRKMRLTRVLGRLFTQTPRYPEGAQFQFSRTRRAVFILLTAVFCLLILLLAALWICNACSVDLYRVLPPWFPWK